MVVNCVRRRDEYQRPAITIYRKQQKIVRVALISLQTYAFVRFGAPALRERRISRCRVAETKEK